MLQNKNLSGSEIAEAARFKKGDTVYFIRQALGYPEKVLKGVIVDFTWQEDFAHNRTGYAFIKAECEYGAALPYNHTIAIPSLKKEPF